MRAQRPVSRGRAVARVTLVWGMIAAGMIACVTLAGGCSRDPTGIMFRIVAERDFPLDQIDELELKVTNITDPEHPQEARGVIRRPLCGASNKDCVDLRDGKEATVLVVPGDQQRRAKIDFRANFYLQGALVLANAATATFVPGQRSEITITLYPACVGSTDCPGRLDEFRSCGPRGTCEPPGGLDPEMGVDGDMGVDGGTWSQLCSPQVSRPVSFVGIIGDETESPVVAYAFGRENSASANGVVSLVTPTTDAGTTCVLNPPDAFPNPDGGALPVAGTMHQFDSSLNPPPRDLVLLSANGHRVSRAHNGSWTFALNLIPSSLGAVTGMASDGDGAMLVVGHNSSSGAGFIWRPNALGLPNGDGGGCRMSPTTPLVTKGAALGDSRMYAFGWREVTGENPSGLIWHGLNTDAAGACALGTGLSWPTGWDDASARGIGFPQLSSVDAMTVRRPMAAAVQLYAAGPVVPSFVPGIAIYRFAEPAVDSVELGSVVMPNAALPLEAPVMWGPNDRDELFVGGMALGNPQGVLFRIDLSTEPPGVATERLPSGTGPITGIWGLSSNEVWAVTSLGYILKRD